MPVGTRKVRNLLLICENRAKKKRSGKGVEEVEGEVEKRKKKRLQKRKETAVLRHA